MLGLEIMKTINIH